VNHVVDSSAWLEYFAAGTNAAHFREPLTQLDRLIVPTVTLFEVFKVVHRQRGEDAAIQAVALMKQGREIPLDGGLALQAAQLRLELKLPMADSIILAPARAHKAELWTQDDDFDGLAGVHYFPKQS
jgi:predicted nucleic acid-binding protein